MARPSEITAFVDHLSYARGLSDNTRDAYRRDIEAFGRYLETRGVDDVADARRADIAGFMAFERDAGFADTTATRRLAALRVFYRWLEEEGAVAANPTDTLSRPKQGMHLPETLTEEQVRALVDAFQGDTPVALRNKAMMELLYACGLRASELVTLTCDDLHLDEAFLRCTGKGGKQRVVPIGSSAVAALREWLGRGRPGWTLKYDDGSLFVSSRGRGLRRETLWRIVGEAARLGGLEGHVHPHTLRHCFATHLLSRGANIRAIQEMLGHADISTTQIYTHVDADRLLAIHRKFHPRP